jgi:hypothetical protein
MGRFQQVAEAIRYESLYLPAICAAIGTLERTLRPAGVAWNAASWLASAAQDRHRGLQWLRHLRSVRTIPVLKFGNFAFNIERQEFSKAAQGSCDGLPLVATPNDLLVIREHSQSTATPPQNIHRQQGWMTASHPEQSRAQPFRQVVVSFSPIGRLRMRLPVAAKIALHSAGVNGGSGGSPTPLACTS